MCFVVRTEHRIHQRWYNVDDWSGDRETRTYIKLYWVTRLTKARYKIMHPNNELGGPRLGRQAAVVSEVEIGARRR